MNGSEGYEHPDTFLVFSNPFEAYMSSMPALSIDVLEHIAEQGGTHALNQLRFLNRQAAHHFAIWLFRSVEVAHFGIVERMAAMQQTCPEVALHICDLSIVFAEEHYRTDGAPARLVNMLAGLSSDTSSFPKLCNVFLVRACGRGLLVLPALRRATHPVLSMTPRPRFALQWVDLTVLRNQSTIVATVAGTRLDVLPFKHQDVPECCFQPIAECPHSSESLLIIPWAGEHLTSVVIKDVEFLSADARNLEYLRVLRTLHVENVQTTDLAYLYREQLVVISIVPWGKIWTEGQTRWPALVELFVSGATYLPAADLEKIWSARRARFPEAVTDHAGSTDLDLRSKHGATDAGALGELQRIVTQRRTLAQV